VKEVFASPYALLLALAVVPAAIARIVRYRAFSRTLLPLLYRDDPAPAGRVHPARRLARVTVFQGACFSAAWILLVCAAAFPRWGVGVVSEPRTGSSIVLVIDVSRSMTAADVAPNRLRYASRYSALLLDRLAGSPCAVVLVKGQATLAVPMTGDHRAVRDLLETASPAMLSAPGSGLAEGVLTALGAFPPNAAAGRTIILFTDGDETSGSLDEAAHRAYLEGARLIVAGVGTKEGAEINARPGAKEPRNLRTRLREDSLRRGRFRRAYFGLTAPGTGKAVVDRLFGRAG